MRIVTVVGARPQFIKAAVLSRLLRQAEGMEELLVHTGQHYDENMSDVFFTELEIPRPAYHLGVGSGPHGQQTGRMLEAIEKVLLERKPDVLLVYGDTNSTLAGALAAAKLHVPIAHVEAGLRSFNRRMPEEINRVLTDHVSTWLFTPTQAAVENLRREGLPESAIHEVGDVMYDAARFYGARVSTEPIQRLSLKAGEYILGTIHRAENTDDTARLRAIWDAVCDIAALVPVVLPLHPRTRSMLDKLGWFAAAPKALHLLPPQGYLDMIALEKHARLIVTDSGGVQKEAFFHRVPCLTLRDETEWVELVQSGWNRLVPPTSADAVASAVRTALAQTERPAFPEGWYGGGRAGERILQVLRRPTSA